MPLALLLEIHGTGPYVRTAALITVQQTRTMHGVTPRALGNQTLLSILWYITLSLLFEKLPTASLDALITDYPSLYLPNTSNFLGVRTRLVWPSVKPPLLSAIMTE